MSKKLTVFTNEEKKIITKISIICDTEDKLISFLEFIEKKREHLLKQINKNKGKK
jgi:hypothetical protein